ncbi:hypothetical protein AOLI_G00179570 [Acnodon oligacanthus]
MWQSGAQAGANDSRNIYTGIITEQTSATLVSAYYSRLWRVGGEVKAGEKSITQLLQCPMTALASLHMTKHVHITHSDSSLFRGVSNKLLAAEVS